MKLSKEEIRDGLNRLLPGKQAHQKMVPPGRFIELPDDLKGKERKSSVLLLLFNDGDNTSVCLIKRPVHMKYHAGQVALPGGRIEEQETALETALRETREEIGIKHDEIEILGPLSEVYIHVSQFLVQPFVGWLNKKPEFILNADEVEKIILFPINHYLKGLNKVQMKTETGDLEVPCISFEDEIIWGATAMILSEFHDAIHTLDITESHSDNADNSG